MIASSVFEVFWNVNCEGATATVEGNREQYLKVKLKDVTSDVKLDISVKVVNCCFVPGTQVKMADGKTKNIEDVKVGDIVLSYNEESKEYENCAVTGLITNLNTTNIARINLKDGTKIEMNEYHPIYTQEGWKSLTNYNDLPTLTKEDKVLSTNNEFIEISSIETWKEETPITTYNLSIEKTHNYFVGNTPVLVHNAQCADY